MDVYSLDVYSLGSIHIQRIHIPKEYTSILPSLWGYSNNYLLFTIQRLSTLLAFIFLGK
jgi:hypothetical protein